jgi:hypothetical protein
MAGKETQIQHPGAQRLMTAWCQYRAHAVQQKKLLDCRVGELLELPRHVKAKHLRGFHVD